MDKKYNFLKPIKNQNLVRLGRKADGGYIVDKNIVERTGGLISFGMGSDWSFELDYIKINKNVKIFMYDCYVSRIPYLKEIFKYLKRFLTFRCRFGDLQKRITSYQNFLNFFKNDSVTFYSEKITNFKKGNNEADIEKVFSRISNIKKVVLKNRRRSKKRIKKIVLNDKGRLKKVVTKNRRGSLKVVKRR